MIIKHVAVSASLTGLSIEVPFEHHAVVSKEGSLAGEKQVNAINVIMLDHKPKVTTF